MYCNGSIFNETDFTVSPLLKIINHVILQPKETCQRICRGPYAHMENLEYVEYGHIFCEQSLFSIICSLTRLSFNMFFFLILPH